jgi:hypothetical protein
MFDNTILSAAFKVISRLAGFVWVYAANKYQNIFGFPQ